VKKTLSLQQGLSNSGITFVRDLGKQASFELLEDLSKYEYEQQIMSCSLNAV